MRFKRKRGQGENQNRNGANEYSHPLLSGRDSIQMSLTAREMVEQLKVQWRRLWQERVDDKIRAEGIATADYCDLFVEKGTVILGIRDYKALNFKEILEQHQLENTDRFIVPNPQIGGWNKFIKISITNQRPRKKRHVELYCDEKKKKQQPKKGGRGWLHL
jgi:hypothetical protein